MIKQDTSNTSQALWIGVGSLFSFLFSVVSVAVLSRFFTKSDYGTYRQVMYVYNTLLSVFTLGLPLAYSYFLPRVSLPEGKALVNKLNICFVVLGFVFSIILYLGADWFSVILKNPSLSEVIKIFSPAPLFILPTMGLQGVFATYKQTLLNAIYMILTRVLLLLCVTLPVIFIGASVKIAIWGFVLGSLLSCIIAFIFNDIPFRKVRKEKCHVTYKEIFTYSIPLMVAGVLGVVISSADQFYISRYFGQEIFADFANGSLELPFVGMVLSAGSTVLLPIFSKLISEKAQKEQIMDLWNRTAVKAAYILYPMITFCIFFATPIMTFLYGPTYSTSAVYFKIKLLAYFFTVVQFYPIILALGKTKEYSLVHVIVLILVWGLEFLAVKYLQSAVSITVISVICKIIKTLLMMKIVADSINIKIISLLPINKLFYTALSCVIAGILSLFVIKTMLLGANTIVILIIGFVIFALTAYFAGILMQVDYLSVVRPLTEKYLRKKCH